MRRLCKGSVTGGVRINDVLALAVSPDGADILTIEASLAATNYIRSRPLSSPHDGLCSAGSARPASYERDWLTRERASRGGTGSVRRKHAAETLPMRGLIPELRNAVLDAQVIVEPGEADQRRRMEKLRYYRPADPFRAIAGPRPTRCRNISGRHQMRRLMKGGI